MIYGSGYGVGELPQQDGTVQKHAVFVPIKKCGKKRV